MTTAPDTDFYAAFLHELNQPITTIRNILELTTYRESNDWPAVVENTLENVERIVELLDLMGELKRLEQAPAPQDRVEIAALLRETMEDLDVSAADNEKKLLGEGLATATWVLAPQEVLRPVLFRILDDAIYHTPKGQAIKVVLQTSADGVLLDVASAGMRLSANESQTLLALAQTGRGPRGTVTRRVFRVALILRTLALHAAKFTFFADDPQSATLRIILPQG
jgi:two-component system heavy metal sensor histidine kinase CusS